MPRPTDRIRTWQDLQDTVAELFRDLGCNAQVNATVQGVRSSHQIDVRVLAPFAGSRNLIVIECKWWNRRVGNDRASAFKDVVADIGAVKGMIISRRGFQRRAVAVVRNTNVELLTWNQLRRRAGSSILKLKRMKCLEGINRIEQRLHSHSALMRDRTRGTDAFWYGTDEFIGLLGTLSILKSHVEGSEGARFPRRFVWALPGEPEPTPVLCRNESDLLDRALYCLKRARRYARENRRRILLDEYPPADG